MGLHGLPVGILYARVRSHCPLYLTVSVCAHICVHECVTERAAAREKDGGAEFLLTTVFRCFLVLFFVCLFFIFYSSLLFFLFLSAVGLHENVYTNITYTLALLHTLMVPGLTAHGKE